ncbi:MAG: putative toxin-antitoxin system toxin component, PIN family [Bacilli bacterium]|nr:putative toxin-antitoxin system toxin component, PIN family [Bacilli bacterium]
MKYYAVIDTNVIVSSMLKHDSIPGEILDLVISKTIVPLLNKEIIEEYEDVLKRNKFGFSNDEVDKLITNLKTNSIFLEREQTLEEFVDEDDIVFYEIVMSARHTMDAFLITGNIKHYPIRNYVVTPKQMIEIIKSKDF